MILTALAFDFTNGFHDTANSIATSVSTHALTPRQAVILATVANLAGAFVTTAVAKTVGKGIIDTNLATEQTLLAALLGAIAWNLATWYVGLPSSSSHALIGGLIGAALVQSGLAGVEWDDIFHKVVIPGILSPIVGFIGAFLLLLAIYWGFKWMTASTANRSFRIGQLFSGTFFAFTHGANDAQKTMGVIALALYTNGNIDTFYVPDWVKVAAGTGDRRRHVRRRLAHHPHARPAHLQHGPAERIRRAVLGRRDAASWRRITASRSPRRSASRAR